MAARLFDRIVTATLETVEARKRCRPPRVVARLAAARSPRAAAFREALTQQDRVNVIAECKRRSPAKGVLRQDYDPAALALSCRAAGAAAVSVLTEPSFFDGSLDHLEAVRAAVDVPVLRKDFIVDEYQIDEARAAGADAVLLIVAVLGGSLAAFVARAHGDGLAAIVEVHDAEELGRAVDAGALLVGVNNRNLRTMTVNLDTGVALAPRIPRHVIAVAESGIRTGSDVAMLRRCGYSAFLVGEQLMRSADAGEALRALLDGLRG